MGRHERYRPASMTDDAPMVPVYCGNPLCASVWNPPKDGRPGFHARGHSDIAIHTAGGTIYRCQKCYYDRLYELGLTQHQVAAAEYAKRNETKEKQP